MSYSCARCDHFRAQALGDATRVTGNDSREGVGICRRYPPRLIANGGSSLPSRFPNVHQDQVCGEFHHEGFVI